MAQEFLLGMNAKIYQGPAGSELSSLTEMGNVKDVTLTLEAGEADVTPRAPTRAGGQPPRPCANAPPSSRCSGSRAMPASRRSRTHF